jgi:hypothetical protein
LRGEDRALKDAGESRRYRVVVEEWPGTLETDQALVIVDPGTDVPWGLVPNGLFFVRRWDVACPLGRYNSTLEEIGTEREREITEAVTLDLRVPVYAPDLVFVRGNKTGRAFVRAWDEERKRGKCAELAWARAVFRVKPRLCTLPANWLGHVRKTVAKQPMAMPARTRRRPMPGRGAKLVRVALGGGRFVLAREGEEDKAKALARRRESNRRNRGGK